MSQFFVPDLASNHIYELTDGALIGWRLGD